MGRDLREPRRRERQHDQRRQALRSAPRSWRSGSSAPNLLGKFNDKTAIEADRTGGACDGNVYFAWSRFTGKRQSNIYFVRSTDHGATWSHADAADTRAWNVQDPDITVTGNGHVYVTYDQGVGPNGQPAGNAIVKSTDCGTDLLEAQGHSQLYPVGARDVSDPEPVPVLSSPDDPGFGEEAQRRRRHRATAATSPMHCKVRLYVLPWIQRTRSTADQLDRRTSGSISSTTPPSPARQ